ALRSVAYLPHRAQTETGLLRIIRIVSRLYTLNSNAAFPSQPSTHVSAPERVANSYSATSRDPQLEPVNGQSRNGRMLLSRLARPAAASGGTRRGGGRGAAVAPPVQGLDTASTASAAANSTGIACSVSIKPRHDAVDRFSVAASQTVDAKHQRTGLTEPKPAP